MLGLAVALNKAATQVASGLRYVRDNLKLYMPFKTDNEVKFIGQGSTSFDGDDYISITAMSLTGEFTVSCWMQPDNLTTRTVMGDDNISWVRFESTTTFKVKTSSGDTGVWTHGLTFVLDEWQHFIITRDVNNIMTIYRNGIAGGTTKTLAGAFTPKYIGQENDSAHWDGSMKSLGVWERALSQTEIQNVMYKTFTELKVTEKQGLVSWWSLANDNLILGINVGLAIDSIGSNNGTVTDATFNSSLYGGDTPKIPRAVDNAPTARADTIGNGSATFNGIADCIPTSAETSLRNTTYCFWAKSTETGSNYGVFGHGSTSIGSFAMNISNKPFLSMGDGSNIRRWWDDTPAQDDGQWHHWAVYIDSSTIADSELYVDGILQAEDSISTSTTPAAYTEGLTIGASKADGSSGWGGSLAQFGVWIGELTQVEIQEVKEKSFAELSASDKSILGDELITAEGDRTFATSYGNWANYQSGTVGWDSGYLQLTTTKGAASGLQLAGSNITDVAVGDIVKAQFDVKLGTMADDDGGNNITGIGGGNIGFVATTSWQTVTGYFVADSTNPNLYLKVHEDSADGGTLLVDNITLKVVTYDLVSYWSLDEDANDDYGSNHGTLA